MSWQKYRKVYFFFVPIEKEVTKIGKDGNESGITNLTKENLLIVQDIWQLHYQILLIL